MHSLKPKTIEQAVGRWPGILLSLGIDEAFLRRKHGACPFCGGHDRFRFDDKNGTGSFFCSQCGAGGGMDFVMRFYGISFKEAAARVDRIMGSVIEQPRIEQRSEAEKVAAIRKVLKESRAVKEGDPVWKYLNRRTRVTDVPADIRFHPGLYHSDGGMHPVMVSVLRGHDGTGCTVHRTYLTLDGEKADVSPVKKFMAGKKLNGGAVRLSRVQSSIGIAEGIETALAASRLFDIPVWAATNAVLLEHFIPPAGVTEVRVCGDNDTSFTGQASAFNLAKRLIRDGFSVKVSIPDQVDADWCDVMAL